LFFSISRPDLVLLFTGGIHEHATTVSVVVSVFSDVVAPVVVDESAESVRHIVFEHSFVDPVAVLSPSTDAASLAIFVELTLVLVWKSIASKVLSDF